MDWLPTFTRSEAGGVWTAPECQELLTKIDDEKGERNVQKLTRRGNLWYTDSDPNKGMYVYYTPTHWKLG